MYQIDTDHEVAIIGGGVAGLSAALILARARIPICVIDDPEGAVYRGEAHNFLTNDGETKARIVGKGAAEVARYPAAEQRRARVTSIENDTLAYELTLSDGTEVSSKRLIFAPGFCYPAGAMGIDGFDARFGQDIFTCPYCHGYEFVNRKIVLIGATERDGDFLRLLSNWSADLHYITHDGIEAKALGPSYSRFSSGRAIEGRVARIEGVTGAPIAVLEDRRKVSADVFFVADLPYDTSWPIIDALGVKRGLHPITGKPVYKTDQTGRTDLGNVFIIGDARTGFSTLSGAAHEGMIAGFMLINDIIEARTKTVDIQRQQLHD